MADIETSVVISAQTDGLQFGLEAASNTVQMATDAMRTQLAGLGAAAQQAHSQISTAAAQVGSSIGAWRAELQEQLLAEQSFFGQSKSEELAFWQDKLALTQAGSSARLAVERNIYELEKQLAVQA